jgi:hypothetical protein
VAFLGGLALIVAGMGTDRRESPQWLDPDGVEDGPLFGEVRGGDRATVPPRS